MWVMLRKKIPVSPSPPKMSIHWSTPYPNKTYADRQKEGVKDGYFIDKRQDPDSEILYGYFGMEPNWKNARGIMYMDTRIRIFPHEFSPVSAKNFKIYIAEDAYELVPYSQAGEILMKRELSKGERFVFDAARLDGCDDYQAMMVVLGKDPNDIPPPIGWYRLRPQYANIFCYAEEQEEN